MIDYELPIKNNKFENRNDILEAISQMLDPILERFIYEDTRVSTGNSSSLNDDMVSGIEGFSRILWALSSDTRLDSNLAVWKKVLNGLRNGTNPKHKYYWGGQKIIGG